MRAKPISSSMIWKARIGSARKYHLSLSHMQQTCSHSLFHHFIAFLEFADCEQAPGAAAGSLEWELSALMPLCLCLVLSMQKTICIQKSQGYRISHSCAERDSYYSHPFPPAFTEIMGGTSRQDTQRTCLSELVLRRLLHTCTDHSKSASIEYTSE